MRIRIAPSILSADFARLGDEIRKIEAGGADLIHVDVMDGHFVPNLTIGPPVLDAIRKVAQKPLDVHLMIETPDLYLRDFADAGASGLTVHVEACRHLHRTVHAIRELGKRAGVALNPATPIESVRHVLGDVDMVLLMTVNPGFGGQTFIESVVPKIRELRALAPDLDIEVDGGIKAANVDVVVRAGANVIVSGSGVFGAGDYAQAITEMRHRADAAAGLTA
ncbi:MAG: ribulose-phosphate 3-epimerase [Myxococcota bacterium]